MDVIIIGSADVVSGCPYNQSDHRVTPSLGSCPSHLIIGQSFNSMQSGDKMTFAIIFIIWCDEMRICHCPLVIQTNQHINLHIKAPHNKTTFYQPITHCPVRRCQVSLEVAHRVDWHYNQE